MDVSKIKALTFDVFGTVVDWRSTIIDEVTVLAHEKEITIDAARFADDWRAGYQPAMHRVRKGDLPWLNIDALHRLILDDLLDAHAITGLSESEKVHLNHVWHRLRPWPDVRTGLERLRQSFTIATLSNGNVALVNKHGERTQTCDGIAFSLPNYPTTINQIQRRISKRLSC